MQRIKASYSLAPEQRKNIKQRILYWASQYDILSFLDSNSYGPLYGRYECLVAVGSMSGCLNAHNLEELQNLHDNEKDWLFGHICYDYKNAIETKLTSSHKSRIGFPVLFFFRPETVISVATDLSSFTVESFIDTDKIFSEICSIEINGRNKEIPAIDFNRRISKETYLDIITQLKQHIADGDCYEINYCCEGFCEQADVNPLTVFEHLNSLSPAPYAAYYRVGDKYLMCASPERYLTRANKVVRSQPIKGTAPRGKDNVEDERNKLALRNSIKEQAENVMIVDLVRNDLARCCETGSIQVDELFGIYTFPQVHQMISTVSGTLRKGTPLTEAIRCSFPMGSMTGAPKYKVMKLIDKYELSRRELFSGTVGYITPEGDFDFNVIIRSLFYNAETKYLSYQTGGAITYDSDPEQEWEEMRLKAWALERIFSGA